MKKEKEKTALPVPTAKEAAAIDQKRHELFNDRIIYAAIGLIAILVIGILIGVWSNEGMLGLKICITAIVFIAADTGAFFMNRFILAQIKAELEKPEVQQ